MQDSNLPDSTQTTPPAPVQPHVDDYIPPVIEPVSDPVSNPVSDPVAGQSDQADLTSSAPNFKSGSPASSVDTSDSPGSTISDEPLSGDSSNLSSDSDSNPDPATPPPSLSSSSSDSDPNPSSEDKVAPDPNSGQSLETQNIFDLLGVGDGTKKEKEDFLDELQEVIWEDFIESDVDLLLTEAEVKDFADIKAKGETPEIQEKMLAFLEKLIPDLEEIMMDKALELKGDLVQERISGMREFHASNEEALAQIAKAEKAIIDDRWAEVATILNSIKS